MLRKVPVNYADYRQNIRSGDLLVWSKNQQSFISNCFLDVIKFATQSEFAHVGIAVRLFGRLFVVEATIPEVRLAPVSKHEEFYHVPMHVHWNFNYNTILLNYLGLKYSIMDCFRAYFGKVAKHDDRYQCAELAHDAYKQMGIDLGEVYTPSELVDAALIQRDTVIQYVHQMVD